MSVLSTHANVRLRRERPELMPVFNWSGWHEGTTYHHRWQIAEVLWILRHKGPASSTGNASKVLRDWAVEMGCEATATLTSQGWSNLFGEMGGNVASRRSYNWDPPLIERRIHGKSTKFIGLNPAIADFPPDPFALAREHRERVSVRSASLAEAQAYATRNAAAAHTEARPPTRSELPPDPGDGAERLRRLLNLRPTEDEGTPTPTPIVEPEPVPAEPEEFDPVHAVMALNGSAPADPLDVPATELDEWLMDPAVTAASRAEPTELVAMPVVSGLADQLANVGDRSMVDNARLLMSLAGDMLTQAMVAEVAPEQVTVEVEVPVEDDTVKRRLADALEEAGRLRKAVQKAQTQRQMAENLARSTEAALRAEREKSQALEANLERVLRGEKVENSHALRTVQRFMAEKPKVGAGV